MDRIPAIKMTTRENFDINKQYFFFNPLVDKEPIPVKIISVLSLHRGVIEVSRDHNARAGMFVELKELF